MKHCNFLETLTFLTALSESKFIAVPSFAWAWLSPWSHLNSATRAGSSGWHCGRRHGIDHPTEGPQQGAASRYRGQQQADLGMAGDKWQHVTRRDEAGAAIGRLAGWGLARWLAECRALGSHFLTCLSRKLWPGDTNLT